MSVTTGRTEAGWHPSSGTSPPEHPGASAGRLDGASAKPGRVLFVQRRLPGYRVPFVNLARDKLAAAGIALEFAYGRPSAAEASKQDEGELPWATRLATRYLGSRLCWQPFSTDGFDLVVVTQENSLLFNHWLNGSNGLQTAAPAGGSPTRRTAASW
jgi:hypothetical protein